MLFFRYRYSILVLLVSVDDVSIYIDACMEYISSDFLIIVLSKCSITAVFIHLILFHFTHGCLFMTIVLLLMCYALLCNPFNSYGLCQNLVSQWNNNNSMKFSVLLNDISSMDENVMGFLLVQLFAYILY